MDGVCETPTVRFGLPPAARFVVRRAISWMQSTGCLGRVTRKIPPGTGFESSELGRAVTAQHLPTHTERRTLNGAEATVGKDTMKNIAIALVVLMFSSSVLSAANDKSRATPNIVVILADDLGYGDVHSYNPERGKIATPHIDHLAAQGMQFTDAHSSSGVCSPSRYTLLTGSYHWRTRLQAGIVGYLERPLIAPDRLTIANLAKQRGYHTACVGKWHLGWDWQVPPAKHKLFAPGRDKFPEVTAQHLAAWKEVFSCPIKGGPTTRGFDEYFGTDVPNWPPYCFIENDRTVGIPTAFLPREMFRNHLASLPGPANDNWKLEAILPALAERATEYIQQHAQSRTPFLLYLPLTSPHTPLAVNEPWRGKSGLDSAVADLIMETDDVVGRVLAALRDNQLEDNTLVLFTSDNGFAPYVGVKHLESQGHFPSGLLRGYKGDAWEGGHRVAFIARWPGVVKPNTVCEQLVHQADIFATVADVLDVDLTDNAGEDSFSLLPLLGGRREPVREHAISHGSSGLAALRMGKWKMLFGPSGGGAWSKQSATAPDGHPAQLYDLAADIGETKNLYADHPEIVEKMTALMAKLVSQGRSTPGPAQTNDVAVNWKRFLKPAQATPTGGE
jgi:arylsulfatase A